MTLQEAIIIANKAKRYREERGEIIPLLKPTEPTIIVEEVKSKRGVKPQIDGDERVTDELRAFFNDLRKELRPKLMIELGEFLGVSRSTVAKWRNYRPQAAAYDVKILQWLSRYKGDIAIKKDSIRIVRDVRKPAIVQDIALRDALRFHFSSIKRGGKGKEMEFIAHITGHSVNTVIGWCGSVAINTQSAEIIKNYLAKQGIDV